MDIVASESALVTAKATSDFVRSVNPNLFSTILVEFKTLALASRLIFVSTSIVILSTAVMLEFLISIELLAAPTLTTAGTIAFCIPKSAVSKMLSIARSLVKYPASVSLPL